MLLLHASILLAFLLSFSVHSGLVFCGTTFPPPSLPFLLWHFVRHLGHFGTAHVCITVFGAFICLLQSMVHRHWACSLDGNRQTCGQDFFSPSLRQTLPTTYWFFKTAYRTGKTDSKQQAKGWDMPVSVVLNMAIWRAYYLFIHFIHTPTSTYTPNSRHGFLTIHSSIHYYLSSLYLLLHRHNKGP